MAVWGQEASNSLAVPLGLSNLVRSALAASTSWPSKRMAQSPHGEATILEKAPYLPD